MMERLDFESFIFGDSFAQAQKDKQRELIAQHTAEFLASGGEITYLDYDPTEEIAARVGRWTPQGSLGDLKDSEGEAEVESLFEPYS